MDKNITKEEIAKIFPSNICDLAINQLTVDYDTHHIVVPSYIGYMELCGYRFPIYKRENIPTKEQQEHLKHTFGITFCLNEERE